MEADRCLLVAGQRISRSQGRNRAGNLTRIVPPGHRSPGSVLFPLIAQVSRGFEGLIMVDAEHSGIERRIEQQPTVLRSEESCPRMPQNEIRAKSMRIGHADA